MATFDLGDMFRDAFGYDAPTAKPTIAPAPKRLEQSSLGQPYYASDLFGREFFLPVTLNGVLIPFAVLGVTWKKTIVETPLPERGGNVNELIAIDDYQFNIKGILINDSNVFPESDLIKLHDIFIINASLTMRSVISDIVLKGDAKVIVKEVKWPAVSGVEHAKPFEMDLKSDMIFDLEID